MFFVSLRFFILSFCGLAAQPEELSKP